MVFPFVSQFIYESHISFIYILADLVLYFIEKSLIISKTLARYIKTTLYIFANMFMDGGRRIGKLQCYTSYAYGML